MVISHYSGTSSGKSIYAIRAYPRAFFFCGMAQLDGWTVWTVEECRREREREIGFERKGMSVLIGVLGFLFFYLLLLLPPFLCNWALRFLIGELPTASFLLGFECNYIYSSACFCFFSCASTCRCTCSLSKNSFICAILPCESNRTRSTKLLWRFSPRWGNTITLCEYSYCKGV